MQDLYLNVSITQFSVYAIPTINAQASTSWWPPSILCRTASQEMFYSMPIRIFVPEVEVLFCCIQPFSNCFCSEKEVFKIMGFDRLRREGSQIEIQDLENNMLDIGKCHGACRHVQSVCLLSLYFLQNNVINTPSFQIYFSFLARKQLVYMVQHHHSVSKSMAKSIHLKIFQS